MVVKPGVFVGFGGFSSVGVGGVGVGGDGGGGAVAVLAADGMVVPFLLLVGSNEGGLQQ